MSAMDLRRQAESLRGLIAQLQSAEDPDLVLPLARRIAEGLAAMDENDPDQLANVMAQSPSEWLDHMESLLRIMQEQYGLSGPGGR